MSLISSYENVNCYVSLSLYYAVMIVSIVINTITSIIISISFYCVIYNDYYKNGLSVATDFIS